MQGCSQALHTPRLVAVDSGWAANSVNTVVFRKNALYTQGDYQYISYYNAEGYVVLGKRKQGSAQWTLQTTPFKGHVQDAHNSISLIADGEGYLHLSWDHHGSPLKYARSKTPGGLDMEGPMPMTGQTESNVTYPEFFRMGNGDILFLYRDGSSGRGNLVMNRYQTDRKQWVRLHSNLIDGEGQRNAYWQAAVQGETIHLSWVWRESPDVASNHDLCYAVSKDGGRSWQQAGGRSYTLPITMASAELVQAIPQKSELINQTSMTTDEAGNPYIASYWRDSGSAVPQYHVVFRWENEWHTRNLGFRQTAFSLSGMGTKQIPISRPQIIAWQKKKGLAVALLFRDAERNNKVSVALNKNIIGSTQWQLKDLTGFSVGSWEPLLDPARWQQQKTLQLFVQPVQQADAEGRTQTPPQLVQVLEWKP